MQGIDDTPPSPGDAGALELEERYEWLRRLARHLVHDSARAEDAAQDAITAALGRADGGRGASRAWLATVLRRGIGRGARSRRHREGRERDVARPETTADTPELHLQQLEAARLLTAAIEGLAEPLRRTVVQTYFEGRSAVEIAAEDGVPAGTVRWRGARARQLLREALVERGGGTWTQWAAVIAPMAQGPAPLTGGAGALGTNWGAVMMWKWIACGALAGALGAGGLEALEGGTGSGPTDAVESASSAGAPRSGSTPDDVGTRADGADAATPSSRADAAPPPAPRPLDEAFGLIVMGQVTGPDGRGIQGGRVEIIDATGTTATARTGRAGAWSVLGLGPGAGTVKATAPGYAPRTRGALLPDAESARIDIALDPITALPVRFELADGEELDPRAAEGIGSALGVYASEERPSGPTVRTTGSGPVHHSPLGHLRLEGSKHFKPELGTVGGRAHRAQLHLERTPPLWVSLTYGAAVLESRPLDEGAAALTFVVDPDAVDALHGGVRLAVVDGASGTALTARGMLTSLRGGPGVEGVEDGAWVTYAGLTPGTYVYRLIDDGYEFFERRVEVPPGSVGDGGHFTVGQRKPFTVRVTADGAPVGGVAVDVARPALRGGPQRFLDSGSSRSDADGVARVNFFGPGEVWVAAGGKRGRGRVARLVDTAAEPDVTIDLPAGERVRIVPGQADRRWVLRDGTGTVMFASDWSRGELCLVPGAYTLELEGPAGAPTVHRIDVPPGGTAVRLGDLR